MSDGHSTARTVAPAVVLGVVVAGGAVVYKLVGATYRSDVETICAAEARSQRLFDTDLTQVMTWVRDHLSTPEGNEFFSALRDEPAASSARRLRTEASALGLPSCPTVSALERLAADAAYRSDIQHLCSYVTFPRLADGSDEERLATLEGWIDAQGESSGIRTLAAPLREGTRVERAQLLRARARSAGVFSCDIAKVVESPPPLPADAASPPSDAPAR